MTIPLLIALSSSVLQLVGYAIYNRAVWTGSVRPNLSSWLVWGGISLVNTFSYFSLSGHDFVVSLMPFTITAVNVLTLLVIIRKGTFQRIGRPDAVALTIAVAATVVWKLADSSSLANLMVQVAIIVGTVPTILGVWRDPSVERPLPWFLWSTAFVIAIIVVTMRSVSWVAYVSPAIQLVMYEAIAWLARRRRNP